MKILTLAIFNDYLDCRVQQPKIVCYTIKYVDFTRLIFQIASEEEWFK